MWDSFPNNKLYEINSKVGTRITHVGLKRREEIVLTRARIGHTYITHSYLLKNEPAPMCIPCHCPFTIKHILMDCIDFNDTRTQFYNVPDLKSLFSDISVSVILDFLKEIGLFVKF